MDCGKIVIDKNSPIPLAEQIANSISRLILNGELALGEKLPTERDLAAALGIARGTVKRSYLKLAQARAIEIRQGSGSYVLTNGRVLELSQKREAADIIVGALGRLNAMGLSHKEIQNLFNLYLYSKESIRKINIMVVSNNYEILAELEKQLSYLSSTSSSFFTLTFMTLASLTGNTDPVEMLVNYDLVIATSIDYPEIMALAPVFRHKIVEASISPRTNTLIALSGIEKEARISIVYRTQVFLDMVEKTLLSMGFAPDRLFPCHELSYNPKRHGDGGVSVVINFNESPVYVDPAFRERNLEFQEQGGVLLHFEYRIDRVSLTYIEDRIQGLLLDDPARADSQ